LHRWHFQQRQYRRGLESVGGQIEQGKHGGGQRLVDPDLAIGNGPGDGPAIFRRAEHHLHIGGIEVDIRRHDQDIPGFEAGQALEQAQQLIEQYLHLPQGAVTTVHL